MIDAITFEVLSHRLSTIVEEGAAILRNTSGSPSVAQSNDCNVAILTADGEGVVIGRNIATHAISAIGTTRYVLKEYRENPRIAPDDMFFTNHPYIGTPHQCCGVLVAPIFVDGRIVAWSGVGIHFGDVGGAVPGQVTIGAQSIWDEPMPVPPIKIVDAGVLRKDIEEDFLIRSRTRMQNSVDLRAMIGANNTVKRRLLTLVRRYGVETFTNTLTQIISVAETKLCNILREIPDGVWDCENYIDYYDKGTLDVYACRLTLSKDRDVLTFDFTRSSKQAPAVINATLRSTEAWLLRVMLGIFGFAVVRCPAAIQRTLRIKTTEGTIVNCTWPAGVSKGTTSVTQSVWHTAVHCLGQMLLGSEKYFERAAAVSRGHLVLVDLQGNDQYGDRFAAVIMEGSNASGSGARSTHDGIDTGGSIDPEVSIANVESNESNSPILYLYRRQSVDSGGAGKFRGGVGVSMAFVPHDVERLPNVMIHSHGVTFPTASGISGGYPGTMSSLAIKRDTNVSTLFERGIMPRHLSQIEANKHEVPPPFTYTSLELGDVFECIGSGGGGYGDPLDRGPEDILDDVMAGLVSFDAAKERYGVMIDPRTRAVDVKGTAAARTMVREDRRLAAGGVVHESSAAQTDGAQRVGTVNHYLSIVRGPDGPVIGCRCGRVICRAGDDYKASLAKREVQNPSYSIREYFCPGCWTLVDTEVFVANTLP